VARDDARRALYVRAKARAQLADARLVFREEIEAAAKRIAEQLDGTRVEAAEFGFLDDVLDVLEAVGHAVERLVEDIFTIEGPVLDIQGDCGVTLDICGPYVTVFVEVGGGSIERPVTGAKKPGQTSAEQLLAVRQTLLEGRDRGRKRLREILEAIRAHEAMRREERGGPSDD
jgi:hypothetical protein